MDNILLRVAETWPWLLTPMSLAQKDLGAEYLITPHVQLINKTVVDLAYGDHDRAIINAPFRSSKSVTGTIYFAAWYMIWNPDREVKVFSYAQNLADEFGFKTREVIRQYGEPFGLRLRRDSSAKAHWRLQGHRGEYECFGRGGAVMGKGINGLGIADDLIANAEEAMSPVIHESSWNWFNTNFLSRTGPGAKLLINNIRWGKNDITAKAMELAKAAGTYWHQVVIPAEAGEKDVLGRKPGEQLWPAGSAMHKSMATKIAEAKTTRWWGPCWQQRPLNEEGAYFKPRFPDGKWRWPLFTDLGDAYSVPEGNSRLVIPRQSGTVLVAVDWALSEKKRSDYTAVVVGAVVPGKKRLILEVVNERWRPEDFAVRLGEICRRWKPSMVGVEQAQFQSSLAKELRAQPWIPEVHWMKVGNQANMKLRRALPAITLAENGRVCLPVNADQTHPPWVYPFVEQLASFDGIDDAHDDMVDAFSHFCHLSNQWGGQPTALPDVMPLTPGYREMWGPGGRGG